MALRAVIKKKKEQRKCHFTLCVSNFCLPCFVWALVIIFKTLFIHSFSGTSLLTWTFQNREFGHRNIIWIYKYFSFLNIDAISNLNREKMLLIWKNRVKSHCRVYYLFLYLLILWGQFMCRRQMWWFTFISLHIWLSH